MDQHKVIIAVTYTHVAFTGTRKAGRPLSLSGYRGLIVLVRQRSPILDPSAIIGPLDREETGKYILRLFFATAAVRQSLKRNTL